MKGREGGQRGTWATDMETGDRGVVEWLEGMGYGATRLGGSPNVLFRA